jgi:sterol desaturase/sphingolipid hydroxylase (fatty acid hydroxylase superfamily)
MKSIVIYQFLRLAPFWLAALALRLTVLTALERRQPAHPIRYREVLGRDLVAAVVFTGLIYPVAEVLNIWVAYRPTYPGFLMRTPLTVRFLLYVVIGDFGFYWVHRLMHTQHVWRVHKWHHSPTYMYFLAGVRGSLVQQVLVNVPYVFAATLLDFGVWWVGYTIIIKNLVQNDWMHLNVPWGSRWVEWFIVTPRYHHIHHSNQPEHYRANLAGLFTIWDRLFGTYVDPETVAAGKLTFGIGEHVPAVRLAIGV